MKLEIITNEDLEGYDVLLKDAQVIEGILEDELIATFYERRNAELFCSLVYEADDKRKVDDI